MRRFAVALALLALVACASSGTDTAAKGKPPPNGGAPPPPTAWTLWFSPTVILGAGPSFVFPTWTSNYCPGPTGFAQTCPAVHYLVNASPVLTGKTLTMNITVSGNGPAWNYANIEQDGNTCVNQANVRFFFQRRSDSWSGAGQYAYYRWWSTQAIPLDVGTFTLTVPLTPAAGWSSVEGETAVNSAAATAGFNAALANPQAVGMTFGGGCFYGHGVDLLSGSASFVINSWTIQ